MKPAPDKLFYNTPIPVSLWFISKDRHGNGHRKREGEVLFIDARKLGTMVTRKLRVLDDTDINQIAHTYHSWRNQDGRYEDVIGLQELPAATRSRARTLSSAPVATSAPAGKRKLTTSRSRSRSRV